MSKKCYAPVSLTCEYRVNPIGLDCKKPRFSWKMTGAGRGRAQSAYQIIAANTKEELETGENLSWDSKKQESGLSVAVEYGGKALVSRERIYWRVRIWDEKGQESPWSETAWFEMGLLEEKDWRAEWICAPDNICAPHFRKTWESQKEILSARAYICGLGYYELYLNGEKCGNRLLTPDRTDFVKRVYYHTYDITEQVKRGKNAAGVILGNGWYNQKDRINVKLLWYGYPKLLMQIELHYKDGTTEYVVSDTDMRWHAGPWTYNNIYFGEIYDARLELPGWSTGTFEEKEWQAAQQAQAPGGILREQRSESDTAMAEIRPVKITEVKPGMYVVDFGQDMTGWVRLEVSGKAGDQVTMRFGEELWPDGKINYYSTGSGWKQQRDVYILKGGGREVYEPKFTWHGFRYVEVQGFPGTLKRENLTAVFVHSGVRMTGSFTCSNALINQIQQACKWSMLSGMHCGIPLDSPHRERQGYGGDALAIAKACMYNFDMERFYSAWMDDFSDAQDENTGFIPHTVPCQNGGGGPAWGCAYIVISWLCYRHYGDERILADHFSQMKRWMDFLATGVEQGIVEGEGEDRNCLGEWSTPGEILLPPRFVNTYFYGYCAGLMAKIARVLGLDEDAALYERLEKDTVEAFRREFYDEETGKYGIGEQGAEAFAYMLGAIREEEMEKVSGAMARHTEKDCGGNLDTGIFGTPYLFETLVDTGHTDTAYNMITSVTYPSYGYMLANGATTLWEYWEGDYGFYQCSSCHNQPMFGSISGSFYEKLAGIRPESPAYKSIIIEPVPLGELRFVSAKAETMYGEIAVDWERSPVDFSLNISVPCNTTATVILPDLGDVLYEGGAPLEAESCIEKGILSLEKGKAGRVVKVGSGDYRFRLEKSNT